MRRVALRCPRDRRCSWRRRRRAVRRAPAGHHALHLRRTRRSPSRAAWSTRARNVLTINDSGDGPTVFVVDSGDRSDGRAHDVHHRRGRRRRGDRPRAATARSGSATSATTTPCVPYVSVYRVGRVTPGEHTVDASATTWPTAAGHATRRRCWCTRTTGRLYVVSKGLFGGQLFRGAAHPERRRPQRAHARSAGWAGSSPTARSSPTASTWCCATTPTPCVYALGPWRSLGELDAARPAAGRGHLASGPPATRVLVSSEGDEPAGPERARSPLGSARRSSPWTSRPVEAAGSGGAAASAASEGTSTRPTSWGSSGSPPCGLAAALGIRAVVRRGDAQSLSTT